MPLLPELKKRKRKGSRSRSRSRTTSTKAAAEKVICTGSQGFFDGLGIGLMPSRPPCPPSTSASAEMFSVDKEMVEALEKVQSILGYKFLNLSLLEQALTHSSYTGGASYERLEFLGDSVLNIVFTNFVYLTNPSSGPGELSGIRSANVNTEKLARVAVRHDFYRYLRHNANYLDLMVKEFTEAVRKEREEDYLKHSYGGSTIKAPKALADVVESIAGAVYEDCGFDLMKFWMVYRGILEPIIEETQTQQPVARLYQLCQKQGKSVTLKKWRKGNMNIFNFYIDGELYGVGSSEQKSIAKLNAAREAMQKLCKDEDDHMEITPCAITSTQTREDQSTSRCVKDGLVICKTNANESVEMDGSKHRLHELCSKKHWPKPVYSAAMEKNKTQASKEKEKSYIHWTNEMDYVLSASLLEQLHLGNKGSNGWKEVAFTAAITSLWDECRVRVSKEKISARMKTWNKYYQEISAMLDTSGFGWDWERHVVQVDSEQVWTDYIKAHPSLKHYKDKVIVNWGDLATLCGTDRANGANASTGVESTHDIDVEGIPEEDVAAEPSGQIKKKPKKTSAIDMIAEAVTHIANNMDNPIEISLVRAPSRSRIEAVYQALSVMTDLSEDDLIKAIDLLSVDATKCEVFLVLPEIVRRRWLRVHIGD